MVEFLLALVVFILGHVLPARTGLRRRLVERIGERAYLLAYSALSVLLLVWLIGAAIRAPHVPLWDLALWQYHVALALMLPASMLFVGGAVSPNPLSITFSRRPHDSSRPGLVGITRHPTLWAFALWSFGHVVPNGDLVAVIMFGGFGLFALAGMAIVDRRKRRQLGDEWRRLAGRTSAVPLMALLQGRAAWRWRTRELLATVVGGMLLYVAFLYLHPVLIGPDPAAVLG